MTNKEQLMSFIEKLYSKTFSILFFTMDTLGNPTAGVAHIYQLVKQLRDLGYDAKILTEKENYRLRANEEGPGLIDWLGETYGNLPHISIESQVAISATDFIVIPEIFSNIMEQVKTFPCRKVVLCQSYDYLTELLPIGKRWNVDYGFFDVITTSEEQAAVLRKYFPAIATHVIPVAIPDYFKPAKKPKKPIVAVSARHQGDVAKLAKTFYLQNPLYNWVTFRDMRMLSRENFAETLADCAFAVWIDQQSGFGTFPIEAMKTETPVIGLIPNLIPEWMKTKGDDGNEMIAHNGIWTNTPLMLPELVAELMKLWLEDSISPELIENMELMKDKYTEAQQTPAVESVFNILVDNRKKEFHNIYNKIEQKESETNETN